jgi:xylulokinase
VFEGITCGLKEGFDVLKSLGADSNQIRVSGGGAKGDFWVQLLADAFEAPCVRLEAEEGPSMGAAILAGVGIGIWPNVAEATRQTVRTRAQVDPSGQDYSEVGARYRSLYAATREWNSEIAS